MNKILFCQFSNKFLNKDINFLSDKYYNSIYQNKESDGYYKNEHFFEIPLWIAEISGSLNKEYKTELYIIKDIEKTIEKVNKGYDYICFSVLDINKYEVSKILTRYEGKGKIILGGYIDFSYFNNLMESIKSNIKICNTVKDFIEYLNIPYEYNLDYSLFKGYKTIPRLTLSHGCLNRCKFCTVEKTIKEVSEYDILKQIESFKPLDFKLVYLNDKTFGQCNNYKILSDLYGLIKEYNSDFKGFIIQTTCIQIVNMLSLPSDTNLNLFNYIFAVELGIETYNDSLLYELEKPQTELTIYNSIELLKQFKVNIIPNILIGIIGETKETYNHTLEFLNTHKESIYLLNIYNLAIYLDSPLGKEIKTLTDNDLNENSTNKSFYSDNQLKDNEYFYNEIFKLALEVIGK